MHGRALLAVLLAIVLIFSVTASALAQQDLFSARILAKGKKSVIMILVVNSSKSTQSIHELEIKFTQGKPFAAISRGWDSERNGNTMTFTAERSDLGPGGRAILIIKVSDPASSVFEWSAKANDGKELQNGKITKIRIREPPKDSVIPELTSPEVNVNKIRVFQGEQLTVTGKGYSITSQIIIYVDKVEVARTTTDTAGTFSTVVLVPNSVGIGNHLVRAVDVADKSSVIRITIEVPEGSLPPLEGGKLVVRTDKEEYFAGDLIRLSGSAVLDSRVSLSITDPKGGIICGQNPTVNNETLLWDTTCFIPRDSISGIYKISAKQIVHRTTSVFTVKSTETDGTDGTNGGTKFSEPGEDQGTLKLTTDKEKYKVGDTAQITLTGARPDALLTFNIIGPDKFLDSAIFYTDESGSVTLPYQLSGSKAIGVWKFAAKQQDPVSKEHFVVRTQITVEE